MRQAGYREVFSIMPITHLNTIAEMRSHLEARRADFPGPVVLVPTMGALHEGHASLIRQGRTLAGKDGTLVVSAFVNPTQFGPNEDLEAYPRTLDHDQDVCERCEVDVLFTPPVGEMYAPDHSVSVREDRLSESLCGASRPGHFPGVCLVVLKLFHIVQPNAAVFGKKDYQQLAVVRRMARDLNLAVDIVGGETVREEDGLAMSSRNENLTPSERRAAPGIQRALQAGKAQWEKAPDTTVGILLRLVRARLEQIPEGQIDYLELVDAETLEPVSVVDRPVVLALAYYFSAARLIDNIEFGPERENG